MPAVTVDNILTLPRVPAVDRSPRTTAPSCP